MYKLYTGLLTRLLMGHVTEHNLLPGEQKALRKGTRGCLDALVIDGAICQEVRELKRDLAVAWIDYQKAYDLIPHRWIKKMLKSIRAPKPVRRGVRALIPHWKTDVTLRMTDGLARVPIRLQRGLFQGDSLSPLLFCLCVVPLSEELRKRPGFKSRLVQGMGTTHLMFMDDLKVFEESRGELEATIKITDEVSSVLGMTLGLKKCAVTQVRKGR